MQRQREAEVRRSLRELPAFDLRLSTDFVHRTVIDIGLRRIGDSTGASGLGLLAAILFEAVAPGSVTLTTYSVAMTPAGLLVPTQSSPVTVTVR